MTLNDRELATVLAALRYWQQDLRDNLEADDIISGHFEEVSALTCAEIDALCERLNCVDKSAHITRVSATILTQTIYALGQPPWELVGGYLDEVEPVDAQGYGMGLHSLYTAAVAKLEAVHGRNAVVVNAQFKILPGRGHDSYGRRIFRVTGDLYRRPE